MPGQTVQIPSNGGTTEGWLALPEQGRGPGLLVVQEWWGLVGHIHAVVERFADAGFVALAPDLYHGEKTRSPDQAGKLMMALDIARAARDLRAAADHLLALDAVTSARVGVVGFCMGGQLALYAGQEHPDRVGAVVDFYGIHPNVPIDPARIRVPVLGHFGRRDRSVPEERVTELFDRLREGGVDAEAHFYDAGHAFFNDDRPEVYSARDAAVAWERTVAFLRERIA
jgi:carboxymethylenebutenolidase